MHSYVNLPAGAFATEWRDRMGAFDCADVAHAEREGREILMSDDNFMRALRPSLPFTAVVASLP
jgi:predicted nucleic acid-binding protein